MIRAPANPKMALDTKCVEPLHIASALNTASDLAQRYQLTSLDLLIQSCRDLAGDEELSVAIIGRFKAGKSSFLNSFLQRDVLPVGVIPVTTVITEIGYAAEEKASVHFLNGKLEVLRVNDVQSFIAESGNPANEKGVSTVVIELPELAQFRALRFIDMPGLESSFTHNTQTSLDWLPRVGLALVAVSVDPPLSQHDIALIKSLYEYTPNVSVLLTKVDLLSPSQQQQVLTFVRDRLHQTFESAPEVFPYSIKPGYEKLRSGIKDHLIATLLADFQEQRSAVLARKLQTVLGECKDYLTFALRSAESLESEREALKRELLLSRDVVEDFKAELQMTVQQAASSLRSKIAKRLDNHRAELEQKLLVELSLNFGTWKSSLAFALKSYQDWLNRVLSEELVAVSASERRNLLVPLDKARGQVFRRLQDFRDRLSYRVIQNFGVPLRTTEHEIQLQEPHTPDIHVGRIFDRNWELLSRALPMSIIGPLVRQHFNRRLGWMIEKNLSRLATQWDESIRGAMTELASESHRRIDEMVSTVKHLSSTTSDEAPRIREDLERLNSARNSMPVNAR